VEPALEWSCARSLEWRCTHVGLLWTILITVLIAGPWMRATSIDHGHQLIDAHTNRTFMDNTGHRVDRWTLDACHLDRPSPPADRRTSCPRKAGRSSPRSAAATVRHPVSHSGSMGGTAHSGPWNDWICILDRKTGLGPGERGSVCAPTLVSCSGSSSVCPAGSTRSDS